MESISDVVTSKVGKFRKPASHEGETERLKKKGREKQARGNTREKERRRRFEESMKRKERMVKLDKKKSGVMDNGDGMSGIHGNKDYSKSSEMRLGRWQMGDGFYVKIDATSSNSTKKTKSPCEKSLRNKVRSKNTKVSVPTSHRGDRKERTKEWVEQVHQSSERSSTAKLSASPRVPGDSATDVSGYLQGPPSWFINRLGGHVEYTPVKRPFREVPPSLGPLSAPTPSVVCVSDSQGTDDTYSVPRHPGVYMYKKSFRSRVVSVLDFFKRCISGKTE